MAKPLDLAIGMRHGDSCTCTPLDPITVTAQPVVVNPDCPGQREVVRDEKIAGRVVITWPRPSGGAISGWPTVASDADTGTPWLDVIRMRVAVDPRGLVTADLERTVDADGNPDSSGRGKAVLTEDGNGYRTAVFRYAVAEMRIAEEA